MKEKCFMEEILNFGYGTMKYFSKNARKIFEEIKKEAKQKEESNLEKVCKNIKEIPKDFAKKCIKNLGFVTEEDLKRENEEK